MDRAREKGDYKEMSSYRFNPHKLLNRDKVWLMTHFCKCGHTYMEHPACFHHDYADGKIPDCPVTEKIGFLDIENSNLSAPFGYVISWAIMDMQSEEVFGDVITPEEIQRESKSNLDDIVAIDKRILKSFSECADKFDKLIVYWGKNRRHDIPFLRHRCLRLDIPFPLYGTTFCVDLFDWVRNMLKMGWGRNSLFAVCNEFGIEAKGTKCPAFYWVKAGTGNQKAIDTIFQHNKEDVICLKPLYQMLDQFARRVRTSL